LAEYTKDKQNIYKPEVYFFKIFYFGSVAASLTGMRFGAVSPPRRVGNVAASTNPMKKDLHPKYNPVVFVDMTTGTRFVSRSTKTSEKKEVIDGVEHSVISIGITSDSHPFFTGQKQFVDTEGRIDKFQKRFGAVRRVGKPKAE
jgi:large subunit ribosomal protein L31